MLVLLPILVPMALSAQPADDGFLVVAQDWEARRLPPASATADRCAARAYHPQLSAGEILWVFDPARDASYPQGYLVVDRRLATADAAVSAATEAGVEVPLARGHDRHAYTGPDDSRALFDSMRRDLSLVLVFRSPASGERRLNLSLRGFSRATEAAAAACGF